MASFDPKRGTPELRISPSTPSENASLPIPVLSNADATSGTTLHVCYKSLRSDLANLDHQQ